MPIVADTSRNFLRGLSDFWTTLFNDTASLSALYDGTQVAYGQLYLDLLNVVLGTSLKHMPLFSKQYFQLVAFTPGDLNFVEGPAPSDDRYVLAPRDASSGAALAFAEAPALLNKVVEPTAVLEQKRDYDVAGGALRFVKNPFNVDGAGNAFPQFPVRTVQVVYPASFTEPTAVDLVAAGARSGDLLQLRSGVPLQGEIAPVEARIAVVQGSTVLLSATQPAFLPPFAGRAFEVDVVRTPFDAQVVGEVLSIYPHTVTEVSAQVDHLVGGTTTVVFTGAAPVVVGQSLYIVDPVHPQNNGLGYVTVVAGTTAQVSRLAAYVATTTASLGVYVVDFAAATDGLSRAYLGHDYVDPGSVTVYGRRLVAFAATDPVTGVLQTWPAGGALVEGVDYALDYHLGQLYFLSLWDPLQVPRLDYTWKAVVFEGYYTATGPWAPSTSYARGDQVTYGGAGFVCVAAGTSGSHFDHTQFRPWVEPFAADVTRAQPQLAAWACDVQVDRDALYTNFGYLLAGPKPSSEQYRAFLRGVAQLFLLGPTLERFESAMNVTAGLPVVRDDGEVLLAYDDGVFARGTNAQTIDSVDGRDGTLSAAASTFASPTGGFLGSDVGAVLRTYVAGGEVDYAVTAVLSATTVVVTPAPADAVDVQWAYRHNLLNHRLRVPSGYAFGPDDVDAVVTLSAGTDARNAGPFRIDAVENPTTVVLDAPYGLRDATGLTWTLSRRKKQTVTTTRAAYDLPLGVPIRADVAAPASRGALTFHAFEALTTAFEVVDYVRDPTWWHHISIPEELLQLPTSDVSGRRRVTPDLVEHIYNALDQPVYGDFGLIYNTDDEGRPGHTRRGPATWYGGGSVVLGFPGGTPGARARDVGTYLVVHGPAPLGRVSYRIAQLRPDGVTLTLDGFPPPEGRDTTPPVVLDVELAPLLYRRTVAFVIFDRFLKYHSVQLRIDPSIALSSEFVGEITDILKQAKPAYTFVYVEPLTDFVDTVTIEDTLDLTFGPYLRDLLYAVDNGAVYGAPSLLHYNDCFVFQDNTQTLSGTPGTYTLTPTAPYGGAFRSYFVFGRFAASVTVTGAGGRRPVEGLDYTFDYATGTLVLASTLSAAPVFNSVNVYLRSRSTGDSRIAYETAIVYNGADPTLRVDPAQTLNDAGLIDRALQLNIS